MSETRRTVSVEIVYEGGECSADCPFYLDTYCARFGEVEGNTRHDECKAEDAREVVQERPFTPKQEAAFLTIKSEIDEATDKLRMEYAKHYYGNPPGAGSLIHKIVYPKVNPLDSFIGPAPPPPPVHKFKCCAEEGRPDGTCETPCAKCLADHRNHHPGMTSCDGYKEPTD